MVVLTACAFACAFGSLLWLHSLGASGRRPSLRRTVFVVLVVCTVAHVALELGGLPLGGWPAIAHVAACVIALGVVVAMTHGQHVASTPVRDDVVVLAVGAHPDDLELACGGTLRGFADSGVPVHAVVMSSGGDGGDAATRREEARAGAGILGVTQLWHLDYPDRRLAVHGDEMIADLEAVIAQVRPTLVLTHSAHDQHQDHAAVHEAVLRAARRQPSILCFESPSVTRGFQPTLYVDVSGQLDAKEAAIAAHADQRGKPYMTSMRARTTAAFRGSQTKIEFAEAFEVERYLLPTSTALLLAQGVPVAHVATGEQSAEASIAPAADAQSTIVAPVAIAARPTPHGALEVRE